ncbi:hypothetical protein ACSBL2_09115 [Pedobacter sp. AW31-3R]|uniref:hypothetical protein n=1 Tax=Pedobacter sp. AW31-3R TaxID=3445781 RepID=UPI003F9F9FE3
MKSLFYEIAAYQLFAAGDDLTVIPMADGVYRICFAGQQIVDLYPEITAAGIYWNGFGLIEPWRAEEIGAAIFAYEV